MSPANITRLAVCALALLALSGCGNEGGGTAPDEAVYARIESLTGCIALQREFDVAARNHDIQFDEGDFAMARLSTSYMEAANLRMRELGCYG